MRDIYLEKIKSAYIHANGGYPSDSQLSNFIYERKELSKKYYFLLLEFIIHIKMHLIKSGYFTFSILSKR